MPVLLVVLFLLVPIAEIWLILQVRTVIGGWETVALLVLESLLGAWLVKREGRRAWRGLQAALRSGRSPGRELSDAALLLVGGTLLLTPGFLTDVLGFLLVIPLTRPLFRRVLLRLLTRQVLARAAFPGETFLGATGPTGPGGASKMPRGGRGRVVPGEVARDGVDDARP